MVAQFFVALVEAIRRRKKRDRIGDVNRDRHLELPAGIPHGIESRIVNFHQRTGRNVLS